MRELNEKCGVFGVFGEGLDVSRLAFYGLFSLQHRGQEGAGIAASDGSQIRFCRKRGLVAQAFAEEDIRALVGYCAIGHVRYSTSKGTDAFHNQPVKAYDDTLAFAHNGNLPSTVALEEFLSANGVSVEGKNDSELMAEAVGYYLKKGSTLREAVRQAFPLFTGAFSVVAMTRDSLVAVRDGCGIRPLVMGKINSNGTVFASETCALHAIGAEFVREVNPGEMVTVDKSGIQTEQIVPPDQKFDIFEFVYFARPDSTFLGRSVYEVRRNCGVQLAKEYHPDADIVVPVPETAIHVAVGYAQESGIPLELALLKNRYIHRTFIEPDSHTRDLGVKMKLVPLPEVLKGKRVVLIDDSIVRGTTSRRIIKTLFEAGASEVHFLISSPPILFPDFYGIDTPAQKDLIATDKSVEEIGRYLGATSLYYLSLSGLVGATRLPRTMFNLSCFTGGYSIDIRERIREVRIMEVMHERQGSLFAS
ncbi:MAG: amidophosphoribosyltransferase [Patescibacteria group bacterium]|nr:amidophosphoribosyltransferase [Patescibacteria group bacterium]